MYDNALVVTYIPDKDGKGGSKTGFHSFADPPWLDVREAYNVGIVRGRWIKDTMAISPTSQPVNGQYLTAIAPINIDDATNSYYTKSIHAYPFYSSLSVADPNALPDVEILSHEMISTPINGSMIYSHRNTLGAIAYMAGVGEQVSAEFLNIGKRCFYTTAGMAEGRVRYRTGSGPSDVTDYPIGIAAPLAALSLTTRTTTGVRLPVYGVAAGTFVNSPTDILVGVAGTGASVDAKGGAPSVATVNLVTGTAISILGSSTSVPITIANGSYIVSFTSGAALITAIGSTEVAGLSFNINGQKCIIAQQGNTAFTADICASNEIALAEPYIGPDVTNSIGWTITGSQCTFSSGNLSGFGSLTPGFSYKAGGGFNNTLTFFPAFLYGTTGLSTMPYGWDTSAGPTWGYGFYDPITGHVSNIGATTTASSIVPATYASATFDTSPGIMSAPDTDHSTRFTHAIMFRTIASGSGSVLFPIGSLQPTLTVPASGVPQTYRHNPRWRGIPNAIQAVMNPVGTSTGWEDCYPDTELLQSGALIAPQFTNDPPTVSDNGTTTALYPKFWEFWDGRLWMVATQDPRAVHFSCDRVQCQIGLPEESFPLTNRLPLSAADGFVRGLELVGNMLVLTTDRYAYYIAGNNETNYRVMRLSTDMYGVGEYQMDEYTGETEATVSVIAFIGRDKRVYMCQPGSEPIWISEPIQDKLDANIVSASDYSNSRLHTTNIGGRKRIVVRTPLGSGQTYQLFTYDLSNRTWAFNKAEQDSAGISPGTQVIPTAFCSVYGALGPPIDEIYGYQGKARSWLHSYDPNSYWQTVTSASIKLFPTSLDGKKTRKQLQFVRLYLATPSTGSFNAYVYVDESSLGHTIYFKDEEDPAYSIYGTTTASVDNQYAKEIVAFAADATMPAGTFGPPLFGYRFNIVINYPSDAYGVELYAIQVGYTLASEAAEVDP